MNNIEHQKKREKELKNKKQNLEKQNDLKIKIDTKNLLDKLARKIAKEF
jgi:hypothetical protein